MARCGHYPLPIWQCIICGGECPENNCEKCCTVHCQEHEKCISTAQQELWNAQAKLDGLKKIQEENLKWKKEEQSLKEEQDAKLSSINEQLQSIKSQNELENLKRANKRKTEESIQKAKISENTKSNLLWKANIILDKKNIFSDNNEENVLKNEINFSDTSYSILSIPKQNLNKKSTSETEEEKDDLNSIDDLTKDDLNSFDDSTVEDCSFINQFNINICPDENSNYIYESDCNSKILKPLNNSNLSTSKSACDIRETLYYSSSHSPAHHKSNNTLRKALSFENISEISNFQFSILKNPSINPTNRILTYYSYFLTKDEWISFYRTTGKLIDEKYPQLDIRSQNEMLNYFLNGGSIYPAILSDFSSDQWLIRNLLVEISKDELTDDLGLEIFQEHWESIEQKFTKDQQTKLLLSLWYLKKEKKLTLTSFNNMLDLIVSMDTKYEELSYDKPLIEQLINLRKNRIKAKLESFSQWSPESCKQIVGILANSHLNIRFINQIISKLKSINEIEFSSLLAFLIFVKSHNVPEAILSKIVFDEHANQFNSPRSWLINLAIQWIFFHLSQKDLNIPESLLTNFRKKFNQNIRTISVITTFVIKNKSLIIQNISNFSSVLETLHRFKLGPKICFSVLKLLTKNSSEKWLDLTDKLIVEKSFIDNQPYSTKQLIEKTIENNPNCLKNDSSESPLDSYGSSDSKTLEDICKQHLKKSLQPRFENELEQMKYETSSAIDYLIMQKNRLEDKLKVLKEDKRKSYDKFRHFEIDCNSKILNIEDEISDIDTELEKIDKEEKENFEKNKQKAEETAKKLGEKSKEQPKQQNTNKDSNVKTSKESEKEKLRSRKKLLNQQKNDIQVSLVDSKITYIKSEESIAKKMEEVDDSLKFVESKKRMYEDKLTKLYQVNQGNKNFNDYELYDEFLSFIYGKIFTESRKKIKKMNKEDFKNWVSSMPNFFVRSSEFFSKNFFKILATIEHAITLSQGFPCREYQMIQFLSILFPFERESLIFRPIEDPLIIIMLVCVSVFSVGQVSLITDSKILSISKTQAEKYIPFFNLLNFNLIMKNNLTKTETDSLISGRIICGSKADFEKNRSNLIDIELLNHKYSDLNIIYNSFSSIFQEESDKSFRKKTISDWSSKELKEWSNHVQKENFIINSINFMEYIAVIKHAVKLAFESSPSKNHLIALFASIDNELDRGKLTKQEQQNPIVLIMANSFEALFKKSSLILNNLPNESSIDLKKEDKFYSLLSLKNPRIFKKSTKSLNIESTSNEIIEKTSYSFNNNVVSNKPTEGILDCVEGEQNNNSPEQLKICEEKLFEIDKKIETSISETNSDSKLLTTETKNYKLIMNDYESIQNSYSSLSDILKSSNDQSCDCFKDISICDWTKPEQISIWAKNYVTQYNQRNERIPELIAVIKRAVELAFSYSPRDCQIICLIVFLRNNKSTLAQVNTGEGKSLIVAMFAAIHALQNKSVDIVTTSTELSIREVKKQKHFFSLLNLTVSENSKIRDKKIAYKSHIVYGTACNFQADILSQNFLGNKTRGNRKNEIVLVDEVDSMLFDYRTHSVRLSIGNPGMNHLLLPLGVIFNYVQNITRHMLEFEGSKYFIAEDFKREGTNIQLLNLPDENWQNHAIKIDDEQTFIIDKTSGHLNKLLRNLDKEEKDIHNSYIDLQYKIDQLDSEKEILEEKIENIKVFLEKAKFGKKKRRKKMNNYKKVIEKIEKEKQQIQLEIETHKWNNYFPIINIPEYWREFARHQIPLWIKNALNALFYYKINRHYKVRSDKIVPINYDETGVLQDNLVWSDGLAQFLQIKEGLPVNPEGISTNFNSNVGFFLNYKYIFGLTGTLGVENQKDFLSEIYGTEFIVIPPFKKMTIIDNHNSAYLCKELAPIIVSKKYWLPLMIKEILYHARKRSVLVICKFIDEVMHLAKHLEKKYSKEKIFTYTGVDDSPKEKVDVGDIILATNIAGRGTDFETSEDVEKNGGLYVCVSFLPKSFRVEVQNFGRTSRSGKKGMGQFILANDDPNISIEQLKSQRLQREFTEIEHAKEDAKRMLLQDALFQNYCELKLKYLPSPHDFESLDLAEIIIPIWQSYLSSTFSESKLKDEFERWKDEKRNEFQKEIDIFKCRLITRDQENVNLSFEKKLTENYEDWKKKKKEKLLENFRKNYPQISDDLSDCLLTGAKFTVEMSEFAKDYKWGKYEGKALDERWALWLKEKNIEQKTLSDALTLLDDFDEEFSKKIEHDAKNDKLIKNPYFYVLKGNYLIGKKEFEKSIASFDRAIDLDNIFSIEARYNKARAMLSNENNNGEKQDQSLLELKKAKSIINTIYRPNLIAFYTLVNSFNKKVKTTKDIQRALDLLSQHENYIKKASYVIKEAKKDDDGKVKDHNVKLKEELIKSTFNEFEANNYDKGIKEANINGLTHFFTVEEIVPFPWLSIVSLAIIGLAQITAGFFMLTTGIGQTLIKEGIQDLITTIKSAVKGSFDWAAWAISKAISIGVSLICCGWKHLKKACSSVKDCVKDLSEKSANAVISDETIKTLGENIGETATKNLPIQDSTVKAFGKFFAKEVAKAGTKELLTCAGKFISNKVFLERLEIVIRDKVAKDLNNAIKNNEIVQKGLSQDIEKENKNWQKKFIAIGNKILEDQLNLHPILEIFKGIAQGVAFNKLDEFSKDHKFKCLDECFKAFKLTKIIAEITTFTKKFTETFDTEVKKYEKQLNEIDENNLIKDDEIELITTAPDPFLDTDEKIIEIDVVDEKTTYCSKEMQIKNELNIDYDNLGPSNDENLASYFQNYIMKKIMNKVHEGNNICIDYATNYFNKKVYNKLDNDCNDAIMRIQIKHLSRKLKPVANETQENNLDTQKNNHNDMEGKSHQIQYSSEIEKAQKEFAENGPKGVKNLIILSKIIGQPINVFNLKGEQISSFNRESKEKALNVVFIKGTNNNPGHYSILSEGDIKNSNYHIDPNEKNCWLDSVLMQLPEEKLNLLGGKKGIIQKGQEIIGTNAKIYSKINRLESQLRRTDYSLEGGASEIINPLYWYYKFTGKVEEKDKLSEKTHCYDILALKTIFGITLNPLLLMCPEIIEQKFRKDFQTIITNGKTSEAVNEIGLDLAFLVFPTNRLLSYSGKYIGKLPFDNVKKILSSNKVKNFTKYFKPKKNRKIKINEIKNLPVESTFEDKITNEFFATFNFGNGKSTELYCNKIIKGKRIEFTDCNYFGIDAAGNELKNQFGPTEKMKVLNFLAKYAHSKGFKQMRIHYQRSMGSSSANPGHVTDMIFDLKSQKCYTKFVLELFSGILNKNSK